MGVTGGARFTIRSMPTVVALLALNLTAAIAAWNCRQPEQTVIDRSRPRVAPVLATANRPNH